MKLKHLPLPKAPSRSSHLAGRRCQGQQAKSPMAVPFLARPDHTSHPAPSRLPEAAPQNRLTRSCVCGHTEREVHKNYANSPGRLQTAVQEAPHQRLRRRNLSWHRARAVPGRATQVVASVERGPEHVSCPSAPRSDPELSHLAWDTQMEPLREEGASAEPPLPAGGEAAGCWGASQRDAHPRGMESGPRPSASQQDTRLL